MVNTLRLLRRYWIDFNLILGVALFLPGCHDGHGNIRQLPPDGEELPILEQYAGKHSHESRSMQLVIRDAATFARIPLQDNVPVDFENQMLLIVTLGRVPSDQYGVNVERVWREGHKLHVATAVQSPAPNAPLAMASPYCIVVIPRCDLNVVGFDPEPGQRVRSWSQSEPGMLP